MASIVYFQEKYAWNPEAFPVALAADRLSIALPIYPGLATEEQEHVIEGVRSFEDF